jgi:hypothetical protein
VIGVNKVEIEQRTRNGILCTGGVVEVLVDPGVMYVLCWGHYDMPNSYSLGGFDVWQLLSGVDA